MYNITVLSENILRFVTDNVSQNNQMKIEKIYSNFYTEDSRDVVACLQQLETCGLIRCACDDEYITGVILLLPQGRLYFKNQTVNNDNSSINVNISNSSGINVGNNNTVNISENLTYEQIHDLIEASNQINKEALHEFIEILKDCLENSKPIPQNKFPKILNSVKDVVAIATAIGNLFFKHSGLL